MQTESSRNRRSAKVAQAIKEELAYIITQRVFDPRIPDMTSIADLYVSPDLSLARVYIRAMGDDKSRKAVNILTSMSTALRSMLCQRVQLRKAPELRFYADIHEERDRLEALIDDIRS